MSLELNTRIGDPTKLGRDCEIHQHKQVKCTFIICYIRMIVFVDIIQILMFYNDISSSHWFPDAPPPSLPSTLYYICKAMPVFQIYEFPEFPRASSWGGCFSRYSTSLARLRTQTGS